MLCELMATMVWFHSRVYIIPEMEILKQAFEPASTSLRRSLARKIKSFPVFVTILVLYAHIALARYAR
jgi:hypothetical protein